MNASPNPQPRPKFAAWLWARGVKPAAAAEQLKCSKQTVLNICQPFGDPRRTVPSEAILEKIVGWTAGEITAGDFYPPHLNGQLAAEHTPLQAVPEAVQ